MYHLRTVNFIPDINFHLWQNSLPQFMSAKIAEISRENGWASAATAVSGTRS
jgi:hypothetical protein